MSGLRFPPPKTLQAKMEESIQPGIIIRMDDDETRVSDRIVGNNGAQTVWVY